MVPSLSRFVAHVDPGVVIPGGVHADLLRLLPNGHGN